LEIKGIGNNSFSKNPSEIRKVDTKDKENKSQKDKIEISAEARELARADLSPQKFEEIKKKMQNNFYNTEPVIKKVAEEILKEIQK